MRMISAQTGPSTSAGLKRVAAPAFQFDHETIDHPRGIQHDPPKCASVGSSAIISTTIRPKLMTHTTTAFKFAGQPYHTLALLFATILPVKRWAHNEG